MPEMKSRSPASSNGSSSLIVNPLSYSARHIVMYYGHRHHEQAELLSQVNAGRSARTFARPAGRAIRVAVRTWLAGRETLRAARQRFADAAFAGRDLRRRARQWRVFMQRSTTNVWI